MPEAHALPQLPQLLGSKLVLVHVPPHEVWPMPQAPHVPPRQVSPAAQALPQLPQFAGSMPV